METRQTEIAFFKSGEVVPEWIEKVTGAPQSDLIWRRDVAAFKHDGIVYVTLMGYGAVLMELVGQHGTVHIEGAPTVLPVLPPEEGGNVYLKKETVN